MADTTAIRGWVMAWDNEPPPKRPVRCLEEELLPPVAPLPPTAPTSIEGRQRAMTIAAKRGVGSGGVRCEACGTYPAVEGSARCHRPICSPAGKVKTKPAPTPKGPPRRICRCCGRRRADPGEQFCAGGACQAMRRRIDQLATQEHGP